MKSLWEGPLAAWSASLHQSLSSPVIMKSPEVTLCGWQGYKPSINNNNQLHKSCFAKSLNSPRGRCWQHGASVDLIDWSVYDVTGLFAIVLEEDRDVWKKNSEPRRNWHHWGWNRSIYWPAMEPSSFIAFLLIFWQWRPIARTTATSSESRDSIGVLVFIGAAMLILPCDTRLPVNSYFFH